MSLKYMTDGFNDYLGMREPNANDIYAYVNCYPLLERKALMNNLRASEWASGYVPSVHKNFLSSGIGTDCVDILTNKTVGLGVRLGGNSPSIEEFEDMFGREEITETIEDITETELTYGSCLARICYDEANLPFIEVSPLGRFNINITQSGFITESTCFLQITSSDKNRDLVVVEKRYYKNNQAYMCYTVGEIRRTDLSKDTKYTEYNREDIPEEIKKKFENIDFNIEYPIQKLGVYLFNFKKNRRFRSMWFGEALLSNSFDRLFSYDSTFTASESDKSIGRGRVLVPAQMKKSDKSFDLATKVQIKRDGEIGSVRPLRRYSNEETPLSETFYDQIPNPNGDTVKPESIQFGLRVDEWNNALDMAAAQVASSVKIAACDLMARLSNGVQKTATEISFDTEVTTSTITKIRKNMQKNLIQMFKDLATIMGYVIEDLFIDWSMVGLSNQVVNTNVISQQYSSGLISKETALKKLNPNWSNKEVTEELERMEKEASELTDNDVLNTL